MFSARLDALKAELAFKQANPDARCFNCARFFGGQYCERDSDFYGKAVTKPDDVCVHWELKK